MLQSRQMLELLGEPMGQMAQAFPMASKCPCVIARALTMEFPARRKHTETVVGESARDYWHKSERCLKTAA